jgi:hypothetical protein
VCITVSFTPAFAAEVAVFTTADSPTRGFAMTSPVVVVVVVAVVLVVVVVVVGLVLNRILLLVMAVSRSLTALGEGRLWCTDGGCGDGDDKASLMKSAVVSTLAKGTLPGTNATSGTFSAATFATGTGTFARSTTFAGCGCERRQMKR